MLFINGNIMTMEETNYPKGYIETEGTRIKSVGPMGDLNRIPDDAMDLKGALVLPGFIDAHTHLGMWEDGLGFEGDDGNEETDPVTPHLRALDAVNPFDRCFTEASEAGITTVLTGPGSANPIAGQWLAMKTGGLPEDRVFHSPIAMKFALGENPKTIYNGKNLAPITRMATAALIREQLKKAQRYMTDMENARNDEDLDEPEYDMKCEALIPVLKREIKAFFHAHRADDILTAIRISKEFNLDYIIVHGTEGHKIASLLKKENVSVITGPVLCDRSKPELRELTTANTSILFRSGVRTAICTDHPVIPIQYLPLSAAVCVKAGLPREEALREITILPAEICGISDRVGSLKAGKDADFCVFEEDPLNIMTSPLHVVINGSLLQPYISPIRKDDLKDENSRRN